MKSRPLKDGSMSEEQLQGAIVALARALGWLVYHTYDSRKNAPGFPDLVLCNHAGVLVFAELKSGRGRVTPEQQAWLDALREVGNVEVCLWRTEDWRCGRIEAFLRKRTPGGSPGCGNGKSRPVGG